jgi:hypothetical protein
MYFGSDNQTGASEQVLKALVEANTGICASYGEDQWTAAAVKAVQTTFECDCEVFFCRQWYGSQLPGIVFDGATLGSDCLSLTGAYSGR